MNTFNLSLDLDKEQGLPQLVTLRQGDKSGTQLVATIYDHGQLVSGSYTARVSLRHPGSGDTYYRETATYSNGVATVTVDEQRAATVAGVTTGYFELLQGSSVKASTADFIVRILPSAEDGAVPGEVYDSAIEDALAELDAATGRISQMVVDATAEYLAAHPEITTTVQDNSVTDAKLIQSGGVLDRVGRLWWRLENLLTATPAEAESVTVSDAAKTPVAELTVFGKSTQDGTPTPDAPVEIESVVAPNLLDLSSMKGATSRCAVMENPDGSLTLTSTEAGEIWVGFTMTTSGTWNDANGSPVPVVGGERIYLMEFGSARRVFITWLDASKRFISYADQVMEGTPLRAITVPSNASYAGFRIGAVGVQASGVDFTVRFVVSRNPCAGFVPYNSTAVLALGKNMLDATLLDGGRNKCTTVHNPDGSLTLTSTEAGEIWVGGVTTVSNALWYPGFGQLVPVFGGGSVYIGQYGTAKRTFLCFYDGAYRSITYQEATPSAQVARVSVPSNARFMTIRVGVVATDNTAAGSSFTVKTVVSASAPDGWTPHAESVTAIPLGGHTLRSLPDGTRDEVTVDQYGHVTLTQRVGSVTLDGNGSGFVDAATMGGNCTRLTFSNARFPNQNTAFGDRSLCTHAVSGPTSASATPPAGSYSKGAGMSFYITLPASLTSQEAANDYVEAAGIDVIYALATPQTIDLGTIDPTALVGPDMTAQAVPTAPFELTYERDLNVTLARLEAALATLA